MGVRALILIAAVLLTCKNPSDFEPDDPYIDPPDPPTIILPLPDTTYNSSLYLVNVLFDWTQVTGAEYYEIQFDTSTTFPNDSLILAAAPPTYVTTRRYGTITTYYCRMRALSASWRGGNTAWTVTRRFYLRPDQ